MRTTRIVTQVDVVGEIWQPGCGLCAMTYNPREYDLRDEDGQVTRDSIEAWLDTHAGDFSRVVDFRATVGDGTHDSEFADEESEFVFNRAMWGDEE